MHHENLTQGYLVGRCKCSLFCRGAGRVSGIHFPYMEDGSQTQESGFGTVEEGASLPLGVRGTERERQEADFTLLPLLGLEGTASV